METIVEYVISPFRYEFMQRALLASVMVGLICSVLSCYLIVKRWALLGDAISHAVLPGVAFAYFLGIQFFIGAIITGVATALGIGFIERNSRIKEDAAMGIMFTAAFALGVLLISLMRTKTIDIYHILFGNVLGVATNDLILTLIAGFAVLAVVLIFFKELKLWSFDPIMANAIGLPVRFFHYLLMFILSLTIVASLQTVGIVLVIAVLITPGATAYLLVNSLSKMMIIASIIGVVSAVTGLFVSFYLNVASGPSMVLMSAFFFVLALFFSPRKGIILEWSRRKRAQYIALQEDLLKHIYHIEEQEDILSVMSLSSKVGVSEKKCKNMLQKMDREALVEIKGEEIKLTSAGRDIALNVIRSHRLWELYLTEKAGLDWAQVHDQAETLEHFADLTVEELDEILEKPEADPHGHPIPSRDGKVAKPTGLSLDNVELGQTAVIKWVKDDDPDMLRYLATMGLYPKKQIKIKGKNTKTGYVIVEVDEYDYALTPEIASSVYVNDFGVDDSGDAEDRATT